MNDWKILHNPRCSKSRQTLELLNSHGIEPEIIEYLKNPLTAQELEEVGRCLALSPSEFVRKKESLYKDLQLDEADHNGHFQAMAENPSLMERPIVIKKDRAVLGRPPENIQQLL